MQSQTYGVQRVIESGNEVAIELEWTAVPVVNLPAGSSMKAFVAMFLTFRDGKSPPSAITIATLCSALSNLHSRRFEGVAAVFKPRGPHVGAQPCPERSRRNAAPHLGNLSASSNEPARFSASDSGGHRQNPLDDRRPALRHHAASLPPNLL
jgi:hypothetical protein